MSIDFSDLDQRLFGWLARLPRELAARMPRPERVALAEVEARLTLLASAVAERRVSLVASDGLGAIAGGAIALPRTLETLPTREENLALYTMRTILDASIVALDAVVDARVPESTRRAAALILLPNRFARFEAELPGVLRLRASLAPSWKAHLGRFAVRDAADRALLAVARAAIGAGPGVARVTSMAQHLARVTDAEALALALALAEAMEREGGLGARLSRLDLPLVSPLPRREPRIAPDDAGVVADPATRGGTERVARARDAIERIRLPRPEDENPLVHSFEKVRTAESYRGGSKSIDARDELEEHVDAIDELEVGQLVRTSIAARSVYRLDAVLSGIEAQPEPDPSGGEGVAYDEWAGSRYRERYCRVFVERAEAREGALSIVVPPDVADGARRAFETVLDARRPTPRRADGDEIDLDAALDRAVSLRAGFDPGDRVYVERRVVERDVATLVLLDASSSADGFLDGRHVLAIERLATATLGDALDQLGDRFMVAGFHSQTHADCRFVVVKDFEEPWRARRQSLLGLEPKGYTRIGAALRHATAQLARVRARRRLLLLVTDGRPTDYDAYEGRYGVDDVRMAFHECARAGVLPHAVCVASAGTPHLTAMFGPSGFSTLASPSELGACFVALEARVRLHS